MQKLNFIIILVLGFFSYSALVLASDIDNSSTDDKVLDEFSKAVKAVKEKDYRLAADLFEKLAEVGDIDAQFNFAILVRNGLGRPQNFKKALFWSWLSYAGGLNKADKVLKVIIELVPETAHEEIRFSVSEFILKKINEGNRNSLMHLGKFYLNILSEPDYSKSYLCFSIASAFGEPGAKSARDEVLERIESSMIVEIQENASLLFEKIRKGEKITSLEK